MGLTLVAITEKTEKTMYDADFSSPVALIMGSEEDGISQEIFGIVDDKVKIPMAGNIESLNVSVSAGVAIYEAIRQRKK
jgi:23S rRNA (guanosine2251-2'-O)-methyltransferase